MCLLFFFATGYGAEFGSMLMWFAFFAHVYCICMRVLIADEPKVCPVGLLVRKTARKD